jgi:hypothetical protein
MRTATGLATVSLVTTTLSPSIVAVASTNCWSSPAIVKWVSGLAIGRDESGRRHAGT